MSNFNMGLMKKTPAKVALLTLTLFFCNPFSNANPIIDPNIKPEGANLSVNPGTPNQLNINQTSPQAILYWQSFNVNKGETTHFVQQQSDVALNHINPQQGASQIFGTLSGNGQIILINQAGIYFAAGSQVNVGSLIASTSDITNKNFLAGKYIFDIHDPSIIGSIVNKGTIIASQHGLIALLATNIDNEGVINAKLGNVVLASGNTFTVSFSNNELISFSIDNSATSIQSGITNNGLIKADGGRILITAAAAEGILDNIINMNGVIQAKSVTQHEGEVILSAQNGRVNVSGHIIASSLNQGGTIKILANNTHITSSAVIDATGKNTGGQIIIASNPTPSNTIPNSPNDSSIAIDSGSLINASSFNGQGGKVIIHAMSSVALAGTILVQGGLAGDGGTIKILGKEIHIASPAVLLATGNTGGGTILIGGNQQGEGPEPNALNTIIDTGSLINASALKTGNGGKVIVWANNKTDFYGKIFALGGTTKGNGGFIEVSGHNLKYHGITNLTAPNGQNGTLLIDPQNLIIQTAGPTSATPSGLPTDVYTANVANSILTVADLVSALTNANVEVKTGVSGNQAGNITVANDITWNNSNKLILSAFLNVNIDAKISNTAGGSLTVNADNTRNGNGTINFDGGSINMSGGGKVNLYYSPATFPTQNPFSNYVNVSNGTVFNTTSFVNNLTSGFVTALNPITPFNTPQIQQQLLTSAALPFELPANTVTIALANFDRETQEAHPKEISSQVICEGLHDGVCGTLTFN